MTKDCIVPMVERYWYVDGLIETMSRIPGYRVPSYIEDQYQHSQYILRKADNEYDCRNFEKNLRGAMKMADQAGGVHQYRTEYSIDLALLAGLRYTMRCAANSYSDLSVNVLQIFVLGMNFLKALGSDFREKQSFVDSIIHREDRAL